MERAAKFENLAKAYVSSATHGTPAFIRMLPTDRCNLDCAYCWQHDNAAVDMTLPEFQAYLRKAMELKVGLLTFLGGEPMTWGPIYEGLALCSDRHVLTDLTTNGTRLTPETAAMLGRAGLDYLNISVDGAEASDVTRKTAIFRPGLAEALQESRDRYHMHTRVNSVIYRDNFAAIRELVEAARRWSIQLSLGFIVPPLDAGQRVGGDIYFTLEDEALLRTIVAYILEKKRAGYPIIDPESYFENIFRFLRREKFWECNYPTRYGWINVAPSGRVRSCTKKMDELDFRFLDLDLEKLRELRAVLREKTAACNIDCYSNCAYDSFYYTHNKGAMLKKVLHRILPGNKVKMERRRSRSGRSKPPARKD
jgi:MoaA/NifB/PqqE/SkfB family radical SAM enzyme